MIVGDLLLNENPSVEKICLKELETGPALYMVRLDKLYKQASGNKMYKLFGFIKAAKRAGKCQLLSFGGAHSNHIHALAATAKQIGMQSIGIIRGESESINNSMLSDASAVGMKLLFLSRSTYRKRYDNDFLQTLQDQFPDALIIPEGGAGEEGVEGCRQIPIIVNRLCPEPVDIFCCAMGTGTTLAGIVNELLAHQYAMGYKIPRDDSIEKRVRSLILPDTCDGAMSRCSFVCADYGGFAKMDRKLIDFVVYWYEHTGILLDPIYTGKLCMKIMQQIEQKVIYKNKTLAIIHSGGLQGWNGMRPRVIKLAGYRTWATIKAAQVKCGAYFYE